MQDSKQKEVETKLARARRIVRQHKHALESGERTLSSVRTKHPGISSGTFSHAVKAEGVKLPVRPRKFDYSEALQMLGPQRMRVSEVAKRLGQNRAAVARVLRVPRLPGDKPRPEGARKQRLSKIKMQMDLQRHLVEKHGWPTDAWAQHVGGSTRAVYRYAKQLGIKLNGRQRKKKIDCAVAAQMRASGKSPADIAASYNCSLSHVYREMKQGESHIDG